MSEETIQIAIEDINAYSNSSFDIDYLKELIESIKKNGLRYPLIVTRNENKYDLVSGQMLYRAAIYSGLSYVPAIIKKTPVIKYDYYERGLINVLNESEKYKLIIKDGFYDVADIALKKGLSCYAIDSRIKMLDMLNDDIKESIRNGEITERHSRLLLKIDDEQIKEEVYHAIINQSLTVRETQKLIDKLNEEKILKEQEEQRKQLEVPYEEENYIYDERYLNQQYGDEATPSSKFINFDTFGEADDFTNETNSSSAYDNNLYNIIDKIKKELNNENIELSDDGKSLNIRILREKNS